MMKQTYLIGVNDGYDSTPNYYRIRAEDAETARGLALSVYNAHNSGIGGRVCLALAGDATLLPNHDMGEVPSVLDLTGASY